MTPSTNAQTSTNRFAGASGTRSLYRQLWFDLNTQMRKTVLVCGVGRSGTTWLGEVVSASIHARHVFEPLLCDARGEFILSGDIRNQRVCAPNFMKYLDPLAHADDGLTSAVRKLFTGRSSCYWVNKECRPGIFQRRVVKEIRANLMLGWIAAHFPEMKILFVIRDPLKTVDSLLERRSAGWGFDFDPAILEQGSGLRGVLSHVQDLIDSPGEIEAQLMLRWCIENYVALPQILGKPNAMVIRYEALVNEPRLWKGIAEFVGQPWDWERFDRRVNKPSITSANASDWREHHPEDYRFITADKVPGLLNMVRRFGLERYCA